MGSVADFGETDYPELSENSLGTHKGSRQLLNHNRQHIRCYTTLIVEKTRNQYFMLDK